MIRVEHEYDYRRPTYGLRFSSEFNLTQKVKEKLSRIKDRRAQGYSFHRW